MVGLGDHPAEGRMRMRDTLGRMVNSNSTGKGSLIYQTNSAMSLFDSSVVVANYRRLQNNFTFAGDQNGIDARVVSMWFPCVI